MPHERTADGRDVLYEKSTGKRFERWPVDAREMLKFEEYTRDASECLVPAEPAPPPPEVDEGVKGTPLAGFKHPLGAPLTAVSSEKAPPAAPFAGAVRSSNAKPE